MPWWFGAWRSFWACGQLPLPPPRAAHLFLPCLPSTQPVLLAFLWWRGRGRPLLPLHVVCCSQWGSQPRTVLPAAAASRSSPGMQGWGSSRGGSCWGHLWPLQQKPREPWSLPARGCRRSSDCLWAPAGLRRERPAQAWSGPWSVALQEVGVQPPPPPPRTRPAPPLVHCLCFWPPGFPRLPPTPSGKGRLVPGWRGRGTLPGASSSSWGALCS